MTRIGEPQRTVRDVPVPYPMPRVRPLPERVPVPVRREPIKEPEKVGVPDRLTWGRIGMTVEEIPYACPKCGREMTMQDGTLYCPEHGVIYIG